MNIQNSIGFIFESRGRKDRPGSRALRTLGQSFLHLVFASSLIAASVASAMSQPDAASLLISGLGLPPSSSPLPADALEGTVDQVREPIPGAVHRAHGHSLDEAPPGNVAHDRVEPEDDFKSSPIMFIENVGQFDSRARFRVQGTSAHTYLADDAIWMTVYEPVTYLPNKRRRTRARTVCARISRAARRARLISAVREV